LQLIIIITIITIAATAAANTTVTTIDMCGNLQAFSISYCQSTWLSV